MRDDKQFDVIIIGGSYAGMAAAMALGRALKQVLIIDSGKPCNAPTPYSHNFLTQDGKTPAEIATLAKQQVERYNTVKFLNGLATHGVKTETGFEIQVSTGETFYAGQLVFATGIKDILPGIEGLAACWGISVLHCPYCHGYEVRNEKTGILGNGQQVYDFSKLISNWTKDLTLFTNGTSTLTPEQTASLAAKNIKLIEKEIKRLVHNNGQLEKIVFTDRSQFLLNVLYAPATFEQHCHIPENLGCELTEEGYIKIDNFQETSVKGIFAIGDNAAKMRTVANAVSMGTTAGITISKKMILEEF